MPINCYDGTYSKEQLKAWSEKGILTCPACGNLYEYCHGRVVMPYFRHKDKNICEDKYSEAETVEHLKGKRDLYEWIKKQKDVKNAILEAWLPDTKQRPDIMFEYKGRTYVIEFQCTPISTEYFERHELYQAAGIIDLWVCGTSKYMQENMRKKELEKYCVGYYSPTSELFYFADNEKYPIYEYLSCLESESLRNKFYGEDEYRRNAPNTVNAKLSEVSFCNNFIFKNWNNIYFDDLKQIKNKRYTRRCRKHNKFQYDYILDYLNDRLENENIHLIISGNNDQSINCSCYCHIYDEYNQKISVNETIDLKENRYKNIDNFIKEIKNQLRKYESNTNNLKSKLYKIKKSNKKLILIPFGKKVDCKFICTYKDIDNGYDRRGYVNEFQFLDTLTSKILNLKHCQTIYLLMPKVVKGVFNDICFDYKFDKIPYYFKRLGIDNVEIYHE